MTDFLRYFIAASSSYLLIWVILKKPLKHLIIQRRLPKWSSKVREFMYSLSTVTIFATNGIFIYWLKENQYTLIYTEIAEYGMVWLGVSFVLMLLLHDAYFYWTHRWMHQPAIFKYVHKVHHLSTNPSPWAAYSFHPLEALVQTGIYYIIIFTVPSHPLALFSFLIYMIARNVLGHLGFELFPKGFVKSKWFNWHTTTTHHDLHHKDFNANYGLYFSWWDRWCNTEHKAYSEVYDEIKSRKSKDAKGVDKNDFPAELKAICFGVLLMCCVPAHSQSPVGSWVTFDEYSGDSLAVIGIHQTDSGLSGAIERIVIGADRTLDPICLKCQGDRKNKRVLGMDFLWGFEKSGDEWKNGKILDPANGEIYNSKAWLANDTLLKVRGYAGPFDLFFRTQDWVKISGSPNSIEGLWKTIDDRTGEYRSMVMLKIENQQLSGSIQELYYLPDEGPNPICLKCEGDLKNQPMIGMTMLWGFQQSNDKWASGKIMDPGNGRTYDSAMWLLDQNRLKVRGYWGPFYRTQIWHRIDE